MQTSQCVLTSSSHLSDPCCRNGGALKQHAVLCCAVLMTAKATPGDYIYLGCVADQDDLVYDDQESRQKAGTPGLPSLLLTTRDMYVTPAGCASAAKRAGKRFFGLQRHTCRAGVSLIKALRHSARRGVCDTLCAPDNICRGGGKFPLATSLYVSKAGKGEVFVGLAHVADA